MSTRKRGELPPVPRARKLWGAPATTVDREPAVYTESALMAYGRECYAAGQADERQRQAPANLMDDPAVGAAIQAEETAWADYRAGRGPYPGRR